MTLRARSPIGRARRAAVLPLLAALWLTAPVTAEVLTLTPDEALMTARAAFLAGQYPVANHIAKALTAVDPKDPYPYLLMAASETQLGHPQAGLLAGRTAWRLARADKSPKALRYEIARHTGKAALDAGRPMLAQYWLRRSFDVAPDRAARQASGRDLGMVRDRTPLRLTFNMEAGPSDNLNGGADSAVFRIGDFVLGNLSNGAVALSGARVSLRLRGERALPGSATAQTVLSFSAETVRNRIDAASKANAGTLTARDLDQSRLTFGLRRDLRLGESGLPVSLSAEVGHNWAGGRALGPSLTLAAQGAVWRGNAGTVWLGGTVQRSWDAGNPSGSDLLALTLIGQRALPGKSGQMSLAFTLEAARADHPNATYDAARLALEVSPEWKIAGAGISFGATAGLRDYDQFLLIGNAVAVTGGRQDTSFGVSMDLSFDDLGVMGFAPVLSVRHGNTQSNVSRYETKTTGISIGISSVF